MENFIKQLEKKKEKYEALEKELSSPELLSDREQHRIKSKEYAGLKEIVTEFDRYLTLDEERSSLKKMIEEEDANSEYAILAKKELEDITKAIEEKNSKLEELLLDEDNEEYKKNVIMEIRAGTGGVEASLFAADLYKMYTKYFENKGWKTRA